MLAVAVLLLYLPPRWSQAAPPLNTPHRYLADVDFWQRTGREQWVGAAYPLDLAHNLAGLPLELGPWRGEEMPETNREVFILLEPEQYVQRRYTNPQGQTVWLTLIGGRRLRSFHPPDLCYDADGWQTGLTSRTVTLADGSSLAGLWLSARKEWHDGGPPEEHRAFYFYLFPAADRRQEDGLVLFRLTSPPYGTDDDTLAVQADFLRRIFTTEPAPNSLPVAACALPLPANVAPETIAEALLRAEAGRVVAQDIAGLMQLWAAGGQVVDAAHTPHNPADDQSWAGADAIRARYLHHVFPGAPGSINPTELQVDGDGDRLTVISTPRINGQTAPQGDRWQLRQVDGCWQIESLTYNLEPSGNNTPK
ncbi:MAG: hypothetical protein Kow0031_08290 [Anaerolineae bacterium]